MADLSLPKTVDITKYKNRSHKFKFAVYSLFPLQDDETTRNRLAALISSDKDVGHMSEFLTDVKFPSEALGDVLDYHLSNAEPQDLNPTLFLVAHTQDFEREGVILVNANIGVDGGVGKLRLETKMALLYGVNIEISNMGWDELPSLDPQSPPEPLPPASNNESQPPTCFGIYGVTKGANLTAIRGLLEPDWGKIDPKSWKCEAVGTYDKFDNVEDNIAEVVKWHPWHCHRATRMNRQWCICVNNLNPVEQGVLLLRIDWDESLEREPKELLGIGRKVSTDVEPVQSAVQTLLRSQ